MVQRAERTETTLVENGDFCPLLEKTLGKAVFICTVELFL